MSRMPIAPVLAIVLLIGVAFLGLSVVGLLSSIIINSIIGLVLLFLVNFIPSISIPITIWTVLIAGFGGLVGVLLLVLLHLSGIDLA